MKSTDLVQFNGICDKALIAAKSIILSNLKLPPAKIDIIATFYSFEPDINLDPSVATATTCIPCALIDLAT